MGVGKTTLGKKLANSLQLDFVDSDEALETKFGCSIAEYFEKYGEEEFRIAEHNWLKELQDQPKVIATGGGMPCFFDNMQVMNQKGVTLYLERPVKELYHRLKNAKQKRPLLNQLNEDELLSYIENKLEEREPFYMKANFTLTREQQTEEIIKGLLSKL